MASFATIPIEARTSVYEYVFSGIVLSPRPVARRTRNGTKAAVGLYPAPLNLYLVNKQVFLETSRILLRFVTIRLKSRDQLQVLARQPLIANLIIGEELSTETDMLTNNAAATTVGALSHLKSIRFELDRCCEVGQSLKAASDRPLTSPRRNHFGWQTQHPSLIYYYSLWHSSPLRTLGWRGGKIMDNLTSMVASGTNVIFVFKEVEFVWRSKNGSMHDDSYPGWMSMRDWIARFEHFGETYEIPQKPYHEIASAYTYDMNPYTGQGSLKAR